MKNDTRMSTAGEELSKSKDNLKLAEDREWDDPTPDNARMVSFWGGQVDAYSAMPADEMIPLF